MGLLSHQPGRGQLVGTWIVALVMIGLLGILRGSTDAEYTFASAAIIPVFLVTWAGGYRQGAVLSILAAMMWVAADEYSGREFREHWIPLLNGLTRLATYCFVVYLTDRVRMLLIRETELSSHDALTGLLNRRAFLEVGEIEANRALRYPHPVAVIFIDLDNFKLVNDRRGHAAGDAALKAVSVALKKSLRATDTVARLGGDEFAVILPEIDLKAATAAANKIANAMSAALTKFPPVTTSLGIAWFEKQGNGFAAMLKAADALMYEMKQDGKGGIRMRSFA